MAAALIATAATLGPITQRAWLKKSAPPPDWKGLQIPAGFEAAARRQLDADASGPWDSVGLSVRIEADGARPQLYREGVTTELTPQRSHRWGRLDVVACWSATRVIVGDELVIEVPSGAVLTHASLAAFMSEAGRARIDEPITRALDGDTAAIAKVELLLPIAHAQLRARLQATPDAAGAPALRTIMVGYEE